ncbi:iron-sulfur cluster biosynthesis family protein [Agrilactobacillus fermenti]|uniref:iron-sulfur cluster biosynthesis family protein n=1 Tax=Agrilactobacillus fermenti TaxID=2586909 RepID=UPI001E367BEA|nr:iron-sulfur cluster biosynthesis family protein [Agrilactobacillus fermenti]MCD2256724.1 iron-sulfur cluster biosynthesis family protein [Agrilactobacillus fermenti]
MQINIKAAARAYLADKIDSGSYVFLATDDGSSKFSKLGGSCAIGNKFQLVVGTHADDDYQTPVENNTDYQLYISDGEKPYLGNGLSLDYKNAGLVLKDDGGLIDGGVTVTKVDQAALSQSDARRKEMNDLGGKIC